MKDLIFNSDTLVLEEDLVFSGFNIENIESFSVSKQQITGNLNLSVIDFESGRPVSNALISIDSIGKTAVCGSCGKVCLYNLVSGKHDVDIISHGFIAQSLSITIHDSGSYYLEVKMISNI